MKLEIIKLLLMTVKRLIEMISVKLDKLIFHWKEFLYILKILKYYHLVVVKLMGAVSIVLLKRYKHSTK